MSLSPDDLAAFKIGAFASPCSFVRWTVRLPRVSLVVIATLVSAGSALNAEAGVKVKDTQEFCRTSDGNGWSVKDVEQAIRCADAKWHVPGRASKAIRVAKCESGLRPRNRNSCCSGVFQQHRSYWPGRFRRLNPHRGWKLRPGVMNARTNVVISIRMASRDGWSAWSCRGA